MKTDEALQKVTESLQTTFRNPAINVTLRSTADDIDGWDSLSHAILIFRIEKTCNVRIPNEVATSFKDVGELVDHIVRLTEHRSD